ncbi:Uu.00g066460.m01.CDS01 [Anthostomella pinea]|uniref:Uu.00g066460.m01.CDS01 n=1 Tax=Anthostomella pinea TaxID=933095 RepID=A0AAI8VND3_9PEZI|nr:Uu.00g066460.m01.CDS01 [Anthostomella pinea]
MTEGVQSTEDAASTRATEQARLRKERREAKIRAGGAARLNKITGLGGGIQRDPAPQPPSEPATTQQPIQRDPSDDPEEMDISEHFYKPQTASRDQPGDPANITEGQLRQMMLGLNRPSPAGTPPGRDPFMGGSPMPGMEGMAGMEGMDQDPMMQMMSKMMAGGMPGGAGGANPFAGTPLESLFGGGGGGANPMQQAQQAASNKTANLWRILHAIFALGLGLYAAFATTFTGTKIERETAAIESTGMFGENSIEQTRAYFFYVFTTVEAVLLTSRYFLDKNKSPPSGWLWTISGFLPGAVGGYARHSLRYGQILSTVRNDALVCIFVLGVCCLLRS